MEWWFLEMVDVLWQVSEISGALVILQLTGIKLNGFVFWQVMIQLHFPAMLSELIQTLEWLFLQIDQGFLFWEMTSLELLVRAF